MIRDSLNLQLDIRLKSSLDKPQSLLQHLQHQRHVLKLGQHFFSDPPQWD